jgi:outer membrane usher protein FimD/PapC
LARERGIFTTATSSPSLLLRQSPTRYAIHAGRNLPDKELRYLRTVIVTAAIHWGFNSELRLR